MSPRKSHHNLPLRHTVIFERATISIVQNQREDMKPKIFIGSSREGINVADALNSKLDDVAECTVWQDNAMQIAGNLLSELINNAKRSDFGIFVFSADDVIIMRDDVKSSVRDNVLFEMGLFIGRLGMERCFFIVPHDAEALRIPTDLAGIIYGRYWPNRADGNLSAALNPVCLQIRTQIARLGPFQDTTPAKAEPKAVIPPLDEVIRSPTTPTTEIFARYYKRSILVSGIAPEDDTKIRKIGGSWNDKLMGYVVPQRRKPEFKELYPTVTIYTPDSM